MDAQSSQPDAEAGSYGLLPSQVDTRGTDSLLPAQASQLAQPSQEGSKPARREDYQQIAKVLMEDMGSRDIRDMIPLLRGVLSHLVGEDLTRRGSGGCRSGAGGSPTARRRGAFSRAAGNAEPRDPWDEEIWAGMIRGVFSRDAAVALENRILTAYTSEPFVTQLAELQASWTHRVPPTSRMDCSREVRDLCYDKVLQQILPQFGLPVDANVQEVLRPYMDDPIVAFLNKEIQEALEVSTRHDMPLASMMDNPSFQAVEACTLVDAALAASHSEGLSALSFYSDSRVQSGVLAALGIGQKGAQEQLPLSPESLMEAMKDGAPDLARMLFGRNAFKTSFLPLLSRLTATGQWPVSQSRGLQGQHSLIGEWPTLELCAAVCIRILCVAQRHRESGGSQLLFVSVGAGCALVEASIALHLGKILGQPVDLQQISPLVFKYGKDFSILFVVSDSVEEDNHKKLAPVKTQMGVTPYTRLAAVRDFVQHGLPLFLFSCWPPDDPKWTETMEATAGSALNELFIVRPPALPDSDNPGKSSIYSTTLRTTELFPKTFSCLDFVGHGFQQRPEVGLFHSHVYCYTPWDVPPPHLADQISHTLDSFTARAKAIRPLESVDTFRRMGFSHILTPEDMNAPLPTNVVSDIKEQLFFGGNHRQKVEEVKRRLECVLPYAGGQCKKMLELLIASASRQRGQQGQQVQQPIGGGSSPWEKHGGKDRSLAKKKTEFHYIGGQ